RRRARVRRCAAARLSRSRLVSRSRRGDGVRHRVVASPRAHRAEGRVERPVVAKRFPVTPRRDYADGLGVLALHHDFHVKIDGYRNFVKNQSPPPESNRRPTDYEARSGRNCAAPGRANARENRGTRVTALSPRAAWFGQSGSSVVAETSPL